jgi:hypothetical protein
MDQRDTLQKLLTEIENTREQLHTRIEEDSYDMIAKDTILLSQRLDTLLLEYIRRTKGTMAYL